MFKAGSVRTLFMYQLRMVIDLSVPARGDTMTKKSNPSEIAFSEGFWKEHGIPPEQERKSLSVIGLAELLSRHNDVNSVQHIVLSHELNMKIVTEQSKATLEAAWLGISANYLLAALTAVGGFLVGFSV